MNFSHEEIKPELFARQVAKTDKQIIFLCSEDFPDISLSSFKILNKNTRLVLVKRSNTPVQTKSSFEIIDIEQSKIFLQNQLSRIYGELRESGKKEEQTGILSDREKIIMRELVLGFTNKEIADRLFISPHTVIAHRKNITAKLGIKSVPGLTIYAILHKLISEDDIKKATQQSDPDTHK